MAKRIIRAASTKSQTPPSWIPSTFRRDRWQVSGDRAVAVRDIPKGGLLVFVRGKLAEQVEARCKREGITLARMISA